MLSFKKAGIFSRGSGQEDACEQEDQSGGVLAVWGSPGSGKTTVAVRLAKYLADKRRNVILLLCDMTAPMLPCICPAADLECERSLGSVLAAAHVSENLVKNNLVTHKRLGYLTMLGMLKGENERSLFQSAGWDLQPGGDSTSDTVTKGWQELYLHPMNFSGIIEMDEIPAIQELLKDAKSFCCYGFDCYERYWDITDEEYLAQLETKREEITHEILERCRTKRKNLYITGPVALNVAQKFSVHRLCDKEGKHNLANRFVGELMEQLVQDGLLVTRKTRNGPGVRTATDAEISSPLPGQQQMTL